MLKRANKITALLVAAVSIMSVVPAMADDSSSTTRLESKDGTIENAIAYKDGKYVYQGYKSEDDTDAIYYSDGSDDKELDDLDDADLNTTYEDKYGFANDGSDQYLVDLTSGDVTDDTTPADDADTAATKLQTKLKKADRYGDDLANSEGSTGLTAETTFNSGSSIDDNQLVTIPGNKFGDSWYAYNVTTTSSDATNYVVTDSSGLGHLYGFTDSTGKYVDASYTANVYAYSTKEGKAVKIENYSNNYDDVDSDSGLLATLIGQPVALTQDADYIYALTTVAITDTASNAVITGGTSTSASAYVTGITGNAKTTIRTYLQKIAKAQGDEQDDAYLPKSVESYEIGNKDGDEYDCDDASDAYDDILEAINDTGASVSSLADVTQSMLKGTVDENGATKPLFTISDDKLVAIKASDDSVDAVTLTLKKDKIKFDSSSLPGYKTASSTTSTASKVSFDEDTKIDAYLVEKDSDDSVDIDNDDNVYSTYDVDISGNVWVVADGKIYKYTAGGDMTKVYTCDSSLDSINVYDENNLIAWEANGDIYTNVSGTETTTDDTATTTTEAKTGWDQLADGTWNYYDATGAKTVSNWVQVSGVWYYFDANGAMATGWQYVGGVWYYLNPNSDGTKGAMKTGWVSVSGTWYYLASSGAMQTGWINDNGTWYYCDSTGAMLSDTTIDGYTLGSTGAMA